MRLQSMSSRETHPGDSYDPLTICAVAVVASCATTVAHEALGHGSACLVFGGRITQLTSVYFQCKPPSPWVAATGPAADLLVAGASWVILKFMPPRMSRLRLLLLLIMALGVFWEAGYLF